MTIKFSEYIVRSRISKRSDVQINVPTFNSYEVTKETLRSIFSQKDIDFDVLLIDNGSDDWNRLSVDFPEINYIIIKENTGSSGAQRIGGELAVENGYKYVIFTDNDALLLNDFGLYKLKKKLDTDDNLMAVIPKHVESFDEGVKDDFYVESWAFHYLFVKTEVFKKIDFHNFGLFLYSDDLSLTLKIASISKILVCTDAEYFHYMFSPKSLGNYYNYFYLRGLLIISIMEKNILLKSRFICLANFVYKTTQMIINSLFLRDISYIHTIYYSIKSFLLNKDFKMCIKDNVFFLDNVNEECLKNFKKINNITKKNFGTLVMPSASFYYSSYFNKFFYFIKRKK